jgi:transposase-like protein
MTNPTSPKTHLTQSDLENIAARREAGETWDAIAEPMGIHRGTLYRWVKAAGAIAGKQNKRRPDQERYGSLTLLAKLKPTLSGECTQALCQCDCGAQTIVLLGNLKSGNTRSCGCSRKKHI